MFCWTDWLWTLKGPQIIKLIHKLSQISSCQQKSIKLCLYPFSVWGPIVCPSPPTQNDTWFDLASFWFHPLEIIWWTSFPYKKIADSNLKFNLLYLKFDLLAFQVAGIRICPNWEDMLLTSRKYCEVDVIGKHMHVMVPSESFSSPC